MKKITYAQVGDDYDTKDPIKKLAQTVARSTSKNLRKNGFSEISDTRGESAYVWEQGKVLMAAVVEGLGTKNLVADEMRKITGKTYYDIIGYDTVATIVNDLITVGAKPLIVHAYWAIEDNNWLQDRQRTRDFIRGWKKGCDVSGATWGGGETPTLKGIVKKETVDLGGAAIGIINSKKRLITDKKLKRGDRILLLKSNGINCNGLSLARAVAKKLPKGYATKLSDGKLFGEAVLTKTNIYADLIQELLNSNVGIHYVSNITGHGLRKIMRARANFTYVIEKIFQPQKVFSFIQESANLPDVEMYQTFNMGADFALFLPEKDMKKAQALVKRNGFSSIDAGYVEKGKRQVVIKPKNLIFRSETLDLR
jgi:phosphoribosylformylglycinamidine cyclo-ligase